VQQFQVRSQPGPATSVRTQLQLVADSVQVQASFCGLLEPEPAEPEKVGPMPVPARPPFEVVGLTLSSSSLVAPGPNSTHAGSNTSSGQLSLRMSRSPPPRAP
jgi:hypothetical protein